MKTKKRARTPVAMPTCHTTCQAAFLRLLLQKLKECKTTTSDQLTFTLLDEKVIEHHLKDVAHEAVLTTTPLDECLGMFLARIDRLIKAEKIAWERVRELIQRNARSLTSEEIIEFDGLSHFFYRINQRHRSEM